MTTATAPALETLYTLASDGVCLNCYGQHHIQACPEIRAGLLPRVATYHAADWSEAHRIVEQITGNQYTLGSGAQYNQPFAVFTMDAHHGGMGYEVFETDQGALAFCVAYIRL